MRPSSSICSRDVECAGDGQVVEEMPHLDSVGAHRHNRDAGVSVIKPMRAFLNAMPMTKDMITA